MLMFRAKSDDAGDVFEELLLRHLDRLFGFAMALVHNRQQAEDLLQEASLKAFANFGRLRNKSLFKPWMLRILRNAFLNRRKKKEPDLFGDLAESPEDLVLAAADGTLFDRVLEREVLEALQRLPEPFRETLWLADVEGYTHKEVSHILECSVGTVGSRLHRARTMLKNLLLSGGSTNHGVSS